MSILFENGSIWQWTDRNEEGKRANWFTITNNKFKEIGFGIPPKEIREKVTKTINLDGKLVLPGLHDSHIHIYNLGQSSQYVNLSGCNSIQELQERIAKKCNEEKSSSSSWIVGTGWEQEKLSRYPNRFDLDEVVKDRPIYLLRACWHVACVNSKAMEIAGMNLNQTSWDVSGGVVDIGENGSPTGILREEARHLVAPYIIEKSDDKRKKLLRYGLDQCVKAGLTAVHTNDHKCWNLYKQLQEEGNLPIRVYLTPYHTEIGSEDIPPPGTKDGLLSCNRVKLFADGSLGAETAAVRLPYCGTANQGVLIQSDAEMTRRIAHADKNGYRVEIHAIGDRAAAQVLNTLRASGIKSERRPILTHCQVLGEDLIEEMSQLGVIADIQPSFVVTDAQFALKRLDKSVLRTSYCWKRLMKSGVVCAGGSDAPIETCNPFQGIYDAMYRVEKFFPEECLTFTEALLIYTKNGAFTAMDDLELGEIKAKFKADFVILKDNGITENYSKLLDEDLVDSVWVDGIQRFKREVSDGVTESEVVGIKFNKSNLEGKNGRRMGFCPCCM